MASLSVHLEIVFSLNLIFQAVTPGTLTLSTPFPQPPLHLQSIPLGPYVSRHSSIHQRSSLSNPRKAFEHFIEPSKLPLPLFFQSIPLGLFTSSSNLTFRKDDLGILILFFTWIHLKFHPSIREVLYHIL